MQIVFERVVAATLALLASSLSATVAQELSGQTTPPVQFVTDVRDVQLPPAPDGYLWHRIEELQVALMTPPEWKRYSKRTPYARVVAFSPKMLDQADQFDVGLTARLLWHPQASQGNEAKAMEDLLGSIVRAKQGNADNKILRATTEDRANKKMLIVRHRNSPAGLAPIIVHTVAIGDPRTGFAYEFIFESPEVSWDENWRVAEPIFRRILVLFQRG